MPAAFHHGREPSKQRWFTVNKSDYPNLNVIPLNMHLHMFERTSPVMCLCAIVRIDKSALNWLRINRPFDLQSSVFVHTTLIVMVNSMGL